MEATRTTNDLARSTTVGAPAGRPSFSFPSMVVGGTVDASPSPIDDTENELWRRLRSSRDAQARQQLVLRYLDLARRIAGMVYAKRKRLTADFEDYLQLARVGLLEAIDRFDPARNANFATFATYRIRGAVLNGLARASEIAAQTAQYRRTRLAERAASVSEGSAPTASGPLEGMVDVVVGLALAFALDEHDPAEAAPTDPHRLYEVKQLSERLAQVVRGLPRRERLIIRHHYFEHLEFIEIGQRLGLSKGRVSQLHARALRLSREALGVWFPSAPATGMAPLSIGR